MPTLMKRLFNRPMPKEYSSFQHFQARQRAESDLTRWHPVQQMCFALGAISGLILASVVILQVIAGASSDPPPIDWLTRLDSVMYLSASGFFAAVLGLLIFNRFFKS